MKKVENNDNFIESLNWEQKSAHRHSSEDVSLTVVSGATANSRKRVSITFRNDVIGLISDTNYILVAVSNNRIYFKASDKIHGYTVTNKWKTESNSYVILTPGNIDDYRDFIGDYELCFDPVHNIYYIDKENM